MKRKLLLLVAIPLLLVMPFITGCGLQDMSSQERITQYQSWAAQIQTVSTAIDAQIPAIEQTITEGELLLQDPLLDFEKKSDILDSLASAKNKLVALQAQKVQADEALEQFEDKIKELQAGGDANFGDEIMLIGEGMKIGGKALPPNLGVWATLGGSLLTIIGGALGSKVQKKTDDKKIDSERADFTALVASVSNGLNRLDNENAEIMKDGMKSVQKTKFGLENKVALIK